jgi:hypothetical protein
VGDDNAVWRRRFLYILFKLKLCISQISHTCKVTGLAPRQSWPLQTVDLSLSIRDASTNLPQYEPSKEDLSEDHQLKGEDVTGRAEVLEAGSIRTVPSGRLFSTVDTLMALRCMCHNR